MVASLSGLGMRNKFFLLVQSKRGIFMSCGSRPSSWKPCNEYKWGLTWYFRWMIFASISTCTPSQNLEAAAVLGLKISSHRTCLIWSWTPSQLAWECSKAVQCMEVSPVEFEKKSVETEPRHDQNLLMKIKSKECLKSEKLFLAEFQLIWIFFISKHPYKRTTIEILYKTVYKYRTLLKA